MTTFLICSVLSLTSFLQSQTPEPRSPAEIRASEAITRIQKLPAKNLDPKLSSSSFSSWFKRLLGPGAELRWEVNDCGEQTVDPKVDVGRDIPTCVEVNASNPHRSEIDVVASINVGSINKGANQKPQFGFASVRIGNRYLFPEQLHCLQKLFAAAPGSELQELRRTTGCKISEGKK